MLSTGTSKLEIVTAESLGGRCTLISAGKDNWIKVSTIRPDNRVHGRYVRVSLVLLLTNIYLTDIYFEGGKDRCKSKDWQPLLICQEIRRCCMNALPASFSTCRPPPPLKKTQEKLARLGCNWLSIMNCQLNMFTFPFSNNNQCQ